MRGVPDDPARLFKFNSMLEVYMPAPPSYEPAHDKLDFPPGDPPEVRYSGARRNYWIALREGSMPFMTGRKVFSPEEMNWLRRIQPQIEALIGR